MAVQKFLMELKINNHNINNKKNTFVLKNQVKQIYQSLFYSKKDPSTDQDWFSVDLSHSFLHFPRIFLIYRSLVWKYIYNYRLPTDLQHLGELLAFDLHSTLQLHKNSILVEFSLIQNQPHSLAHSIFNTLIYLDVVQVSIGAVSWFSIFVYSRHRATSRTLRPYEIRQGPSANQWGLGY